MASPGKNKHIINILLWVCQVLLAFTFIWAAYMKLFAPPSEVAAMWPWTGDHPNLTKVTGAIDLLAGLGLVLPMLLNVMKGLTVLTAYGTILLMIAASAFHIIRGEVTQIGFNIFVIIMASFIAWGRSGAPKQE